MRERIAGRLPLGLERVDPQIERSAGGERHPFGDPLLTEDTSEIGIEPLRIVACDPGRRAAEIGRAQACTLLGAQRRGRKATAVGARRDRLAIELALEPQHPQQHRARALVAHDLRARGTPTQRIVNEPRDRRAVG